MDRPPQPTGDLTELRAIHRHLFQDLYDRAGQVRTVDIRKNVEGAEFFLPSGMIERASAFAAGELHTDDNLRGLDREHFIDRLAYHSDQQDLGPLRAMFDQIVTPAPPARNRGKTGQTAHDAHRYR
jgi:cell filamentation protein